MIERCRLPSNCRMTRCADMIVVSNRVAGIVGLVVIILVAGITILCRTGIAAIIVTSAARQRNVGTGQTEAGQIMIETGGNPSGRRMALSAIVIIRTGRVIRILRTVVNCLVAGVALCNCSRVLTLHMAFLARH
jgi:hypothetical protein